VTRATYRPFNALDELEAPTVVAFDPSGQHIAASGFRTDRTIHIFDTARPGRQSTILRLGKTRRSSDGQKGLVSTLAFHSDHSNLLAVGTYAPGSIYVYDIRAGTLPTGTILQNGHCIVGHGRRNLKRRWPTGEGLADDDDDADIHSPASSATTTASWISSAKKQWFQSRAHGGVTQLLFAPNDHVLYSASRQSNTILAWDLRMLSNQPSSAAATSLHTQYTPSPTTAATSSIEGLASYATDSDTNQRLEFDLDETGETLYVGGKDQCVRMYNTKTGELTRVVEDLEDAANGVSFCRIAASSQQGHAKRSLLAVTTGSRHFPTDEDWDNESESHGSASEQPIIPGQVLLYSL
jgi:WD40 repeat protein